MADRGTDYWNIGQLESQIDTYNRELETIEYEKKAIIRREKLLRDAKANLEAELADRFRGDRESSLGVCEHGYAQGCRACNPDGRP